MPIYAYQIVEIAIKNSIGKMERATGIEPVLPAWESRLSILYFQYLQNRFGKINVHATHTVHAVPDLRVAGRRLGDGVSDYFPYNADLKFVGSIVSPTD